jgi:hypothetical protein
MEVEDFVVLDNYFDRANSGSKDDFVRRRIIKMILLLQVLFLYLFVIALDYLY